MIEVVRIGRELRKALRLRNVRLLANRHGVAIEAGRHVISLGWNVWGWDRGDKYVMWHLWPFRTFVKR